MGQRQQRFLEGRWKQFLFFFFFPEGERVPNVSEGCLASQEGCKVERAEGSGGQLAGLSCITLRTEGAQDQEALTKYCGPVWGTRILIKENV